MKSGVVAITILLLAAGVFGNYLRYNKRHPDRIADFSRIPLTENGFTGDERRFDSTSYEILKADTTTLRLYRGDRGDIYWLFIAYFSSQKYGSQIHSPKHCLPGGGWVIESIEPYRMSLADGTTKEINRVIINERTRRQLMFYWFETRGGAINNEFELKWDLMKNSLLLRPTDAAIVRLTMPFEHKEDITEATKRANQYISNFHASIEEALPFQN